MSLLEFESQEPGRFNSEHARQVIGSGPLPKQFTNVVPPAEMRQPTHEIFQPGLELALGAFTVDTAIFAEIRPMFVSTS